MAEDEEVFFEDAEINRLSNQLLSDIAAYSGDEIDSRAALPDVPDYHGDLPDPLNLTEHENPMII